MQRFQQVVLTLTLLCAAAAANAASLSFVYTGDNNVDNDGHIVASVGDLIDFDIVMDFTDEPTIGGGFDVFFTTDSLQFESWESLNIGDGPRQPRIYEQLGLIEDAAFGSFNPLTGPATLARVSFIFLGGPVGTVELAQSQYGVFIGADFITPIDVDFGSATIRTPLPGAAWLLMSAMGALVAVNRGQTTVLKKPWSVPC